MVSRGVHRRVPAHVGHEHEQRVDPVGIAGPGVADDRVHHAVRGQRRVPGERLVDARAACRRHRPAGPPGRARSRAAPAAACRRPCAVLPAAGCAGGSGFGIGRLVAEDRRAHRPRRAASAAGAARGRCGSRWSARRCRASRGSPPGGRSSLRARGPSCRSRRSAAISLLEGDVARVRRRCRRMVSAGMPQRSPTASGA